MEAVKIPAHTLVHIHGVPVRLAVETIVETEHGNMGQLVGHHYVPLPEAPSPDPPKVRGPALWQDWYLFVEDAHGRRAATRAEITEFCDGWRVMSSRVNGVKVNLL